jgi:hypothetical protein
MPDILLATHSNNLSELIHQRTKSIGFDVRRCNSAHSVKEAFKSAQKWQPFKVVIIDCKLPKNDGSLAINEDEGINLVREFITLHENKKKAFSAAVLQNKPTCQFIILANTWDDIPQEIHPRKRNNVSIVYKGASLGLMLEREIRKGLNEYWKRQHTLAWVGFIPIIITGLLIIIEDFIRGPDFSGYTLGFGVIALLAFIYIAAIRPQYPKITISATR